MPRHLEQVLAHAENQLTATGAKRPTEVLPLYKKFLKIEEHRLRLNHQAGGSGREICARRVDLVDWKYAHRSADLAHRIMRDGRPLRDAEGEWSRFQGQRRNILRRGRRREAAWAELERRVLG